MGKPRMTRRDIWLNPPRIAVAKYRKIRDDIQEFVLANKYELPNSFKVRFYLPMAESWSKKKKLEMDGAHHMQKPDIDNVLKALLDCMKKDDELVFHVEMDKYWSINPRVEIETTS